MLQLNSGDFIAGKCGTAGGINCMLITQQRFPTFPTDIEAPVFVSTHLVSLGTSAANIYNVTDYVFIKSITLTNVTSSDVTGISLYLNGTTSSKKFISDITIKANTTLHFDTSGFSQYPVPVSIGGGGGSASWGGISGIITDQSDLITYINSSFSDKLIFGEEPIGILDGSNATFTTLNNFVPGSEELFLNGVRQKIIDDYNTSGTDTIIFNISPTSVEKILINYIKQ